MIILLIFIAVCFLAFSNGANDNFKGVATLFGSGTTNYKSAITWATLTTVLGSVTSVFLAQLLVKNFSGKGLVPDEFINGHEFAIAIALGAGLTVMLATKIGMPISTTHGLVGALVGAGFVAVGMAFNFQKLGKVFFLPLILSPFMAAVLSFVVYLIFRKARILLGVNKETCICVGEEVVEVIPNSSGMNPQLILQASKKLSSKVAKVAECREMYQGNLLGIKAQTLLDYAHYLSAGIVSFARGLNDTPKIVGLLLIINVMDIKWGMMIVATAMAVGGLLSAKKVGIHISKDITPMNHGQGFSANLITG
ncbi:MAG: phosphate permease, partial [Bacteroidetes bacterium]